MTKIANTRTAVTLTLAFMLMAYPATSGTDDHDVFTDDFSQPIEGLWEATVGTWSVNDGHLSQTGKGDASHYRMLANFPYSEGTVEVQGTPQAYNGIGFASIGIILRYVDQNNYLMFRYGSYGALNLYGAVPGDWGWGGVIFGRVIPQPGESHRLEAIMRNGVIGLSVDGVMLTIMRDPQGPVTGRAGLCTETHADFDDFRVVRTKA